MNRILIKCGAHANAWDFSSTRYQMLPPHVHHQTNKGLGWTCKNCSSFCGSSHIKDISINDQVCKTKSVVQSYNYSQNIKPLECGPTMFIKLTQDIVLNTHVQARQLTGPNLSVTPREIINKNGIGDTNTWLNRQQSCDTNLNHPYSQKFKLLGSGPNLV